MEEETNQPKRGILRNKSEDKHHSGIHWDEMNILMTHHPPDKDYGHIKINEPPTPYNKWKDPDDEGTEGTVEPFSDDEADPEKLDPENLQDRIKDAPKRRSWEEGAGNSDDDDDDDDDDDELSESQKALNKEFKDKRKKHYNEYSKVKLARKLIEQELKDLEDDNDSVENNTKEGPSSSQDAADTQMDET